MGLRIKFVQVCLDGIPSLSCSDCTPQPGVTSATSCCSQPSEPSVLLRAEDARRQSTAQGRAGLWQVWGTDALCWNRSCCSPVPVLSFPTGNSLCPVCTQSPFPGAAFNASQRH